MRSGTWQLVIVCALGMTAGKVHAQGIAFSEVIFGGPGSQWGNDILIVGDFLYYCGMHNATGDNEGRIGQFSLPPCSAAPNWEITWPGLFGSDAFFGMDGDDALYVAGSSYSLTTDAVGDKEPKSITAKFDFNGVAGAGPGGSLWTTQTPPGGAFPYNGFEGLNDVVVADEGGTPWLYVTGNSQPGGVSERLYLSKLDVNGVVQWTVTDGALSVRSHGNALSLLNGFVYASGRSDDNGMPQPYLVKYDTNGVVQWAQRVGNGTYNGIHAAGGFLYTVGQTSISVSSDFLIAKWDEGENLLWSRTYDRDSANDKLFDVVELNGRLIAVGSTTGLTAGGTDAVVLEIDDASGDLLSSTLWGDIGEEAFNGVVSNGATVYAVGQTTSFGADGQDMMIVGFAIPDSSCPADTNGDGTVNVTDLLALLAAWGVCP